MNKSLAISRFLRLLADAVENTADEDLERMLRDSGLAGITDLASPKRSRASARRVEPIIVRAQAEELLTELASASTREEAAGLLNYRDPPRSVILQAARIRELHVRKAGTAADLREKLVENIVGARLDSAAIRGD